MKTEKYIFLNCKESTYLAELQQEEKLDSLLSMKLKFHLSACGPCKRFVNQTLQISSLLKEKVKTKNFNSKTGFSTNEKEQLKEIIKKNQSFL